MSKRRPTDKALDLFIERLKNWNGTRPTFQDIVIDAAAICARLQERNKDGTAFVEEFAKQVNLTQSHVRGWITGKTPTPPLKLARIWVNEIRIFLERKRVPPTLRPN